MGARRGLAWEEGSGVDRLRERSGTGRRSPLRRRSSSHETRVGDSARLLNVVAGCAIVQGLVGRGRCAAVAVAVVVVVEKQREADS